MNTFQTIFAVAAICVFSVGKWSKSIFTPQRFYVASSFIYSARISIVHSESFLISIVLSYLFRGRLTKSGKREGLGTKTGALGGAVAGGLAAGPIGAVVGAVGGGILGHELHKVNHPKVEVIQPVQTVDQSGVVVPQGSVVSHRVKREGAGTKTGALGGAVAGK